MRAVQGEGLYSTVSAIRNHQARFLASDIDEKTVRRIEFAVAVTGPANLIQKFPVGGKTEHMVRAVAIADVEISVGGKRHICGNEIDRMFRVGGIFARISVGPKRIPAQS